MTVKKVSNVAIGIAVTGITLGLALAVAAVSKPFFDRLFARRA